MELKFFYKPGCPYCRQASEILDKLMREKPEYAKVEMKRIDETTQQDIAARFDYWYVPSFFLGEEKLYEADPSWTEGTVRAKLEDVLKKSLEK